MAITTNPCIVLTSPQTLTLEYRPTPALLTPTSVLIRISKTGICGSDMHYYRDGRIGPFIVTSPLILGHESSGTVVLAGPEVTTLSIGDRVCLEPGIPCRECHHCKAGKYNLCRTVRFAATPPHDGTLAKYFVLPEDFCVKLPENVSLEDGALVEPLAVAVHVVRLAEVAPGKGVVVFGAGPIGLLCCAVARAFGARGIVAVDIVPGRLEFARRYAATGVYNVARSDAGARDVAAEIVEMFGLGEGADVAVDATGAEKCINMCVHVVKPGGTVVQVGMGRENVAFPIGDVCMKEVTVKGSFRYGPGDYKLAVELLASGKVTVAELVTGRVAFEDAEKAFEMVGRGGEIKVLIDGPLD